MDIGGTLINAAVVTAVGIILGWLGKGRFEALEARLGRLEGRVDALQEELRGSIDGLRSEMTASIDGLRVELTGAIGALRLETTSSIDGLRSDLTAVALAVGARPRAENG